MRRKAKEQFFANRNLADEVELKRAVARGRHRSRPVCALLRECVPPYALHLPHFPRDRPAARGQREQANPARVAVLAAACGSGLQPGTLVPRPAARVLPRLPGHQRRRQQLAGA